MATTAEKSAELVGRLERLPFSRWHRNLFALCFVGVMFDACDFALFGMALPPVAREFGLNQAQAGLLATVGLIGAFLGALFWGPVSDSIRRRTDEAEGAGSAVEAKASEGRALPPLVPVAAGVEERGVTVFELLTPDRRKRTILLWIVSFCFLWSSNGIIFMLPQILVQRGFELKQIFIFLFVQAIAAFVGYPAWGFLIARFGRLPLLFLSFFLAPFFHLWLPQLT